MNRKTQALIRRTFEAIGPAPTMTFFGKHKSVGGGATEVHFLCANPDEVEAYIRRAVAFAPHVIVAYVANDSDGTRRLLFTVDDDCPGLADGPVHREHLRDGLLLAKRALDACLDAGRAR